MLANYYWAISREAEEPCILSQESLMYKGRYFTEGQEGLMRQGGLEIPSLPASNVEQILDAFESAGQDNGKSWNAVIQWL